MNRPEKISYTVPLDVLLDIVQIILQSELKHTIEDYKRTKNALVLELELEPKHRKAKENIETILMDYNFYRYNE